MTTAELIERLQQLDPDAEVRIWTRVIDFDVSWPADHVEVDVRRAGGGHRFVMIHGTPR